MGIQGFMSFVCSHNDFFHELKLKNTKLIIDGNNLYYTSYFDSGLDLVHGGDYDKLTDVLNKFFESLSMCNIQAYVVFDGGCDISDKKLETQKQRIRDKIKMAHNLSEGRAGSVLPLLSREVCIHVLRKLQVPFVQCFSEADREIVVLANLWNCPILSFDSDFCIFDLKAGYCPQNSFHWRNVVTPKGTRECYIPARCFSAQKLCRYYNMNIALLPLFAVLTGNDYISLAALETFFSKAHLPVGNTSHGGRRHTRIHGLLCWLSRFADVEEAMENVLSYLRVQDRDSVRQLLYSAMEEYNLDETVNLGQYFLRGLYVSPTAVKLKLPDWVQLALARGELSPLLSDALVLRRVFLHAQVEDFKKPSAHLITKPVRRLIYALLLNASSKTPTEGQRSKELFVVEFDRMETSLRRSIVEISYVYDDISKDISLSKLPQLPQETRLKLLLWGLDLKINDLEFVPPSYKLVLAIVCYWITHAEPKVKLHHFKALLTGIVCGEAFNIQNKPDEQQEAITSVCEQIRRMHLEGAAQHRSLNLDDVHIFCQWQCCLQMYMHLNYLLCTPLPNPDITRLYSGSLVYHITQKLKTSPSEDLFKSCPSLEQLYQNCIQAVMSTIPQDHFQSRTKQSDKSKEKGKVGKKVLNTKVASMLENKPPCDVSNRFADLGLED
ncbi:asteroid homolog 1 [Pristimantis euphronides]